MHLSILLDFDRQIKEGTAVALNAGTIRTICHLLKLPPTAFSKSLTHIKTTLRGETVEKTKTPDAVVRDIHVLMRGLVVCFCVGFSFADLYRGVIAKTLKVFVGRFLVVFLVVFSCCFSCCCCCYC